MTVTTARAAGVGHVVACTPPRDGAIDPAVLFALDAAGADTVLALGGVQAIAAMAMGCFGAPPADVLAGPGNALVAGAKRRLFGAVGIDMIAGPADCLILADASADPRTVAADLIGQAEHGPTSPVWLATDHEPLALAVATLAPALADAPPAPNGATAAAAWRDCAEIILCDGRETMAAVADLYAAEHLHAQAAALDWWLDRLRVCGSPFLGSETTVPFGDKTTGPNRVLPTARAARHAGGLSVGAFLRTATWRRATTEAAAALAGPTARISRAEGMVAHALSAGLRA